MGENMAYNEVYPVEKKNFSCAIKNKQDITLDSMRFFFQQAEKYLNNIRDNNDTLDSKATNILTADTAFLLSVIGLAYYAFENSILDVFLSSIIAGVCFIVSTILCFIVFSPRGATCSGSAPRYLMDPKFIKDNQKGDIQLLQIMMNECEVYQDRIDILHLSNKFKSKRIKWAIFLTWTAPLLGGLGFILFQFYLRCR